MIKKANINWTAKQLCKMIDKQTINFDNAVQRGFVWDLNRKSLLIHSMIVGYPIPAFYAAKNSNGYDMLDGKQRSNTIHEYINNDFALSDLPEIETEDNSALDISGLEFSQLPEEIQDTIKDYSLTIYYFDGITDDEITEMFYRLNNGKPLSSFDLMRTKIKCHDKIKDISKHEIFTSALTEKALSNNKAEDLAIKAWAILYMKNPSFERKELQPILETSDITTDQVNNINNALNRIFEVYKSINDDKDTKLNKRIAKRVLSKTHLISLIPITLQSITDNVSISDFSNWIKTFYNGKDTTTIDDNYNDAARSGSAKTENINKRLAALKNSYTKQFPYYTKYEPSLKVVNA